MSAPIPSPPGPSAHWLLGNLPEFRRDPLFFLTYCARTYGDVSSFRILRTPVYQFCRPEAVEAVLSTHSRSFMKGRVTRALVPLLGNGLFTSEGARWIRLRKLNQPAFRREQAPAYFRAAADCVHRMLDGWRDGDALDFHDAMNDLTIQIAARVFFGVEVEDESAEMGACLHNALKQFREAMDSGLLIPARFPTPANVRLKRTLARLDAIIYQMIRRRKASARKADDLLFDLLQTPDAAMGLSDRDLRDEIVTMLVAGQETTAVLMSWTLYLLSQHADVAERLAAEIAAVIGDRAPTLADLPRFQFAGRVLLESMRLYPPAWSIPRRAIEDCTIDGVAVRRGTSVTLSPWVIHRDPRHFASPSEFQPDRWRDGLSARLPRFAYFPFGGGPRGCIGESQAGVVAMTILVSIAQRFRLRYAGSHPVVPWPTLTLQPRGGVRMQLELRRARPKPGLYPATTSRVSGAEYSS